MPKREMPSISFEDPSYASKPIEQWTRDELLEEYKRLQHMLEEDRESFEELTDPAYLEKISIEMLRNAVVVHREYLKSVRNLIKLLPKQFPKKGPV